MIAALSVWLYLLLAHLLADFVFQPYLLVVWKRRPAGLAVHTGIHAALTGLMIAPVLPRWALAVAFLGVAHYVIDATKVRLPSSGPASLIAFFGDQIVHLGVLGVVAALSGVSATQPVVVGTAALTRVLYHAVPYLVVTFALAITVYQIAVAYRTRPRPEELLELRPRAAGSLERAAVASIVLFLPPVFWLAVAAWMVGRFWRAGAAGRRLEVASGLAATVVVGLLFRA